MRLEMKLKQPNIGLNYPLVKTCVIATFKKYQSELYQTLHRPFHLVNKAAHVNDDYCIETPKFEKNLVI